MTVAEGVALLNKRLVDVVLACLVGNMLMLLVLTATGHYDSHLRLLFLAAVIASFVAARVMCTGASEGDDVVTAELDVGV